MKTGSTLSLDLPTNSFFLLELKELVSLHLEKTLENEDPLTGDEVLIIKVWLINFNSGTGVQQAKNKVNLRYLTFRAKAFHQTDAVGFHCGIISLYLTI